MTEFENVNLVRQYAMSPARLYELLTEPAHLERWFSPAPEVKMTVLKHNAKIGGLYEFSYQMPNGEHHIVVGEYCALSPPNLIAFTWGWTAPDPDAGTSTLVTMTLTEAEGGTKLSVLHEKLHKGEMADRHNAGWAGTLDQLDNLVATQN